MAEGMKVLEKRMKMKMRTKMGRDGMRKTMSSLMLSLIVPIGKVGVSPQCTGVEE